jgi:hypothetical protein
MSHARFYAELKPRPIRRAVISTRASPYLRGLLTAGGDIPPEPGAAEDVVQAYMGRLAERLAARREHHTMLVDRHISPSIGSRKPDFVGYRRTNVGGALASHSTADIVFVGDVKARRTTS